MDIMTCMLDLIDLSSIHPSIYLSIYSHAQVVNIQGPPIVVVEEDRRRPKGEEEEPQSLLLLPANNYPQGGEEEKKKEMLAAKEEEEEEAPIPMEEVCMYGWMDGYIR